MLLVLKFVVVDIVSVVVLIILRLVVLEIKTTINNNSQTKSNINKENLNQTKQKGPIKHTNIWHFWKSMSTPKVVLQLMTCSNNQQLEAQEESKTITQKNSKINLKQGSFDQYILNEGKKHKTSKQTAK